MTTIHGGSHDGETLDATIEVQFVPMSHVVDGQLIGVDWYQYRSDTDELHAYRYEDYTWMAKS